MNAEKALKLSQTIVAKCCGSLDANPHLIGEVRILLTRAIEEEAQALHAQVAELREGLKPFASEYSEWDRSPDETIPDIKSPEDDGFDSAVFTVGDLHRAFDLVARIEAGKPSCCEWKLDEPDYNAWKGTCGRMWCLTEGTPNENKIKFCPYCGKPIRQIEPPATDTP